MRSIIIFFLLLFSVWAAAQIDSVLLNAIKRADMAAIGTRLKQNIEINATDNRGANALMFATYYCELPTIKNLVRFGALPPKDAQMPMPGTQNICSSLPCVAAHRLEPDVMEYLADSLHLSLNQMNEQPRNLETGNEMPMMYAIVTNHKNIIRYLLSKSIRADAITADSSDAPFLYALSALQFDAFRLLFNTEECSRHFGKNVDSVLKVADQLERLNVHQAAKIIATRRFALDLCKTFFGDKSVGYARILEQLGAEFIQNGDADSGEVYNYRAMALLERIGKKVHPEYLACLNNLAFGCYNTAKYREALKFLDLAMELIPQVYPLEVYHKYTVQLNQADALPPRTPVVWPTAYTLNFYATVYSRMGQYALALKYFRQALAIAQAVCGENSHYAYVANLMAAAYAGIGLYDEALLLYRKSLNIRKGLKLKEEAYCGNLMDIGYAYNQTGQYKEALPCFEEAAVTIKKWFGEKHQYYAMCTDGEAYVYEHIGDYEKAVAKYRQAFNTYKEVFNENHPYCAFVLNNLANLYKTMGRYKEAFSCYRQALAVREKAVTENHPDYAQNLSDLAALHADRGNLDSAMLLYKKALLLIEKNLSREHPYYAATLAGLARLCQKRKAYDSSLLLYTQALAFNKKTLGEDFPGNVDILNQIANLHRRKANDSAAAFFKEACRLQLTVLNQTYSSLSEAEKLAFVQQQASVFDYLPSYLFERPALRKKLSSIIYQNELALKAMVMEDQKGVLNTIRQNRDSALLALYKQWQFDRALLCKEMLRSRKERDLSLDSLQEAANLHEQELSRRSTAFQSQKQQRNVSVAAVAKNLRKDEAAVEFIRFRYYENRWTDSVFYAALVLLPNDSVPNFVPLCEEKVLRRLLAVPKNMDTAYALQKIYRPENSREPDMLYRLLWKPLQSSLRGVKTIYIAAAGLLHQVAFSALRDESSQCLVNKYSLRQFTSTRSVALHSVVNQRPATVSLWGGIQYDATAQETVAQTVASSINTTSTFNFYTAEARKLRGNEFLPLPNTKKEIALLKEIFCRKGIEVASFSGSKATEESFKQLDGNSPQVLHLATHGFFLPLNQKRINETASINAFTAQPNPMFRSGLVLAGGNATWKGKETPNVEDGILTAYEIAQLDLSKTDLMVLSACETALGDVKAAEGVIGLQRAVKLAGVKQMVLSLWRVPDKETVELMNAFYTNWLGGLSTHEALRKAQLEMKKKYPPFFWAGFVLIE